jgi:hypothetical protein
MASARIKTLMNTRIVGRYDTFPVLAQQEPGAFADQAAS